MIVEVVLLQDVPKLGVKGQSVEVKGGYFRNYLAPEGLATYATPTLKAKAEEINAKIALTEEQNKQAAKQTALELQGKKIKITEKLNKKGKLYKQVSLEQILEAIKAEHGIEVPTEFLSFKQKIKEIGTYDINLNLGYDQTATVLLTVEGEQDS
jgi:large subunit ribosomal protein L9